jgi:hypothetical protein
MQNNFMAPGEGVSNSRTKGYFPPPVGMKNQGLGLPPTGSHSTKIHTR